MVNYTLGDLIHDSFRVTHGMIAVFPQTGHEVTLSVDFFIAKFNGHYSANNSTTIGFICQNRYYVTPYTARAIATLVENGFIETSFYVPFSALGLPEAWSKTVEVLAGKGKKDTRRKLLGRMWKILQRAPHWSFASSCDEKELHDPGRGTASKACSLWNSYLPSNHSVQAWHPGSWLARHLLHEQRHCRVCLSWWAHLRYQGLQSNSILEQCRIPWTVYVRTVL